MARLIASSNGAGVNSVTPTVGAVGRLGHGIIAAVSLDGNPLAISAGWSLRTVIGGGVTSVWSRDFDGTESAADHSPTITAAGPIIYVTGIITWAPADLNSVVFVSAASIPTSSVAHQAQNPTLAAGATAGDHYYVGFANPYNGFGAGLTATPDAPLGTNTATQSGVGTAGPSQLIGISFDVAYTPVAGFSGPRTWTVTGDVPFNPSGLGVTLRDTSYTNPVKLAVPIPPLHIPHKEWASSEEQENYLTIERWARNLANSGAKVWGDWDGDGEEWWMADGNGTSGVIITPPDPDPFRYSGGSDNRFQYLLNVDNTYPNQFRVGQFDMTFGVQLASWEITGWTGNPVGLSDKFWDAFSSQQPLSANSSYIVVIANVEDRPAGFYVPVSFDVTVFNRSGNLLYQWSIPDVRQLSEITGTFLRNSTLYFGIYDNAVSFVESVAKIDVTTGVLTDLFTIPDVDAAILALDPSWGGLNLTAGIVESNGELIINGETGIARVEMDGTPVWWHDIIQPVTNRQRGLALSGHGSVWSCDDDANADEYDLDGTYIQSIVLPEFAGQAWSTPSNNSPLHIPHKEWILDDDVNGRDELQNYLAMERWSRDTSRQLHIPHKSWSGDREEQENYLEIERWSRALSTR